ncbi:MAG: alpha/beta fold hydrolase [Alphaproteobacteria bacterium]|nr:alpha/beta fold hydrolase [Alphaproteobacteria bacterium]
MELSGPTRDPAAGGPAREIVLLLHGLGADGDDLIGLAPYLAQALPHAAFAAPNAPFPCDMAPYGYQWFSLQDRSPAMMLAGVQAAAPLLDAYVDDLLARHGLGDDRLAFVGFSQGTMMSLHVAPRRGRAAAGVVGFSGALLAGERLAEEVRSRPPVLLVHGDADPVVPFQAMATAAAALDAVGVAVATERRPGVGHSIDEAGLRLATAFLQDAFAP